MHRRRHLAIAGLIATLAIAAALPTAAAAKTRWVDDDGKAGPVGCSGSATAAKKVQAAIIASGPDDTVKVCPGTYTGRLLVQGTRDGLKLLAATSTKPVLRLPSAADNTVLEVFKVDRVTVKGFTIRSNSADSCEFRTGIEVDTAKKAVLSQLRVESTGSSTYSGCLLGIGISVIDSGATIRNVRIVNATSNGLTADRSAIVVTKATADYLHAESNAATAGVMFSAGPDTTGSFTDLTVNGLATAGTSTPRLSTGVRVSDADAGFVVQDVTVSHALTAVRIDASGTTVAGVSAIGTGSAVTLASGSGIDVSGVTVDGGLDGIFVSAATNSTIHDNDLTGASITGCRDETSGDKTLGTANTWTNNLTSTTSTPAGLCTEP